MANNLIVTGNLGVGGTLSVTGTVDFPGGALNADLVTDFNADKVDGADLDTTVTLGTSDVKVPSQKAVKTYADARKAECVALTGDQTVAGVKTFTSIPVLPASNPTTDNQAARKAYVDGLDAANVKMSGEQSAIDGEKGFLAEVTLFSLVDPRAGVAVTATYSGTVGITQNAIFDLLSPYVPTVDMAIRVSGGVKVGASVYIVHNIIRTDENTITINCMTTLGVPAALAMVNGSATAVDAVSVSW